jgi:cytochrome c553
MKHILASLILPLMLLTASAWADSPAQLLKSYEASSGKASAARGEQFFSTKHGKEWSCSSCHSTQPNKATEHIVTGKRIEPLAPSANANRFTDAAKSEKWFKRNCKDVLSRECSAQEKADVIAWLLTIK